MIPVIEYGPVFEGLVNALSLWVQNIEWVLLGAAIGMVFGILPGLGGTVTVALLLPFTLQMDAYSAFAFLSASLGAVTFAGSITAILFNTPGTISNSATLLDGYPMALKGEAARAIGASATSSAVGAMIGITAFIISIPFILEIVVLFGLSEMFWIVLLGLSLISGVAGDRYIGGLLMGGLGLYIAFIGTSVITAESRFTFGTVFLLSGINLIPVVIGLFAIAEMFRLVSTDSGTISDPVKIGKGKMQGVKDTFENKFLVIRSSLIGLFIAALPGVGGLAAAFIAYGQAVQTSSNPEEFGKGRIEGVIATESAADSKDGGQLFPTLGLGIPGSGSMAVILAGFLIHGIAPGPRLLFDHLDLMLLIALSLLLSNIITSTIGLLIADKLAMLTRVPVERIIPIIVVFSFVACFVSRNSYLDMIVALIFGLLGVVLVYFSISRVPLLLALVLGGMVETFYFQAVQVARGNVIEAFFTGWLNQILIVILVLSLIYPVVRKMRLRTKLA